MNDYREKRIKAGLTQQHLAQMVGCNQATIARIEKGESCNKVTVRLVTETLDGLLCKPHDATGHQTEEDNKLHTDALLRDKLVWLEDQLAESRAREERLMQLIENLTTKIAGPRPEQGRADAIAPPAIPASGAPYKTHKSKSA